MKPRCCKGDQTKEGQSGFGDLSMEEVDWMMWVDHAMDSDFSMNLIDWMKLIDHAMDPGFSMKLID